MKIHFLPTYLNKNNDFTLIGKTYWQDNYENYAEYLESLIINMNLNIRCFYVIFSTFYKKNKNLFVKDEKIRLTIDKIGDITGEIIIFNKNNNLSSYFYLLLKNTYFQPISSKYIH